MTHTNDIEVKMRAVLRHPGAAAVTFAVARPDARQSRDTATPTLQNRFHNRLAAVPTRAESRWPPGRIGPLSIRIRRLTEHVIQACFRHPSPIIIHPSPFRTGSFSAFHKDSGPHAFRNSSRPHISAADIRLTRRLSGSVLTFGTGLFSLKAEGRNLN